MSVGGRKKQRTKTSSVKPKEDDAICFFPEPLIEHPAGIRMSWLHFCIPFRRSSEVYKNKYWDSEKGEARCRATQGTLDGNS